MRIGDIVLPVELECAVFEAAAFLDYKNISRLLLVARRVHTWLEPLLYRVLVCRGSAIPHRLWVIWNVPGKTSAGSTDFVQRHVRHILFSDDFPYIEETLSVCSRATDLVFYSDLRVWPSIVTHLDHIRPHRLSIELDPLFAGTIDFSYPMFSRITHLDVIDYNIDSWMPLASLPALTHLSFNLYILPEGGIFKTLLSECNLVQALIVYTPVEQRAKFGDTDFLETYPMHDARFVVANNDSYDNCVEDWRGGAWNRADLWARVDNFIRMKQWGEIPKENYLLVDGNGQI
ncbi:hypothetical protein C8J57DRAFT_1281037 [Mycena rebaudengoi]|nr:hypothetical protein C8J57DRAFT_1281037 [Mycena rebaudengoi]